MKEVSFRSFCSYIRICVFRKMDMHIHIYITYIYVYAVIYIYTHPERQCTQVRCNGTQEKLRILANTYAYLCIRIYIYTHIHTCTYKSTFIYIYIYTCVRVAYSFDQFLRNLFLFVSATLTGHFGASWKLLGFMFASIGIFAGDSALLERSESLFGAPWRASSGCCGVPWGVS